MKKEELIKRLERVNLPEMQVLGHRQRLKQVLMEGAVFSLITEKKPYAGVSRRGFGAFFDWLKGPAWRPALASALSVIVLAAILAAVFYVVTPSPAVIAADVVKRDPTIQQKLSGAGEIIIVRVDVQDRVARVVCGRGMGDFIEADVDISDRTVVNTRRYEGLFMAELTPEAHENAINIALLDPRVKPLLARGATVGRVFPVFTSISSIAISNNNIIKITPSAYHAIVPIYVDGKAWLVDVNLEEKKIDRIIEPQSMFMPYFRGIYITVTDI
jgi:hypothetical protein